MLHYDDSKSILSKKEQNEQKNPLFHFLILTILSILSNQKRWKKWKKLLFF